MSINSGSDAEFKERVLRLLESDREFRYAVMGLLGFRELLERFSRLEERQQRLEERFASIEERQLRLEEEFRKLEERFARIEERQQKLEERFAQLEERFARIEERQQELEKHFAKLEERFTKLEERYQRLEERVAKLEERFAQLEERFAKLEERFAQLEEEFKKLAERQQRLEERFAQLEERQQRLEERFAELMEGQRRLEKSVEGLKRSVGALGRRLGIRMEGLIREIYRDLLEEHGIKPLSVQKLQYVDVDGRYIARGAVIEVDIYVHDDELWLLEVKAYAEPDDVLWFHEKTRVAERILGKSATRRMLLAIEATKDAKEVASKLGVELLAGEIVEE